MIDFGFFPNQNFTSPQPSTYIAFIFIGQPQSAALESYKSALRLQSVLGDTNGMIDANVSRAS